MATSMADLGFNIDSSPMRRASRELDRMSTASGRAERSADGLAGAYRAVGAAVAALGLAQLTRSVFDTVRSTEALKASLKTVTGSISEANAAWDTLEQFAKTTPFTLDQSVNGFIRMKSLGLDPTTEALNSFGNTASAMGKDLMQMIEAVADASTGEFERLREFGIRARNEGENIRFIFQGTETVVANSSTAITGYLESLGNTAFAGAVADQMDTVGGQVSNLVYQIDSLFRAIGDAGATDLFKESIAGASGAVETLTNNLDQVAAAAAGVTAATGAYLLLSNATAAATVAQVAFNAAARVNPYIFIASTIAGATAAVWAFTNAQSSATEVWERATESEAAYQAALADVGAANRVQEIVRERMELEQERQELEEKGFRRYGRDANRHAAIVRELAELEREYHAITDARIEAEKAAKKRREEARAREEEALKRQAEIKRQLEAAREAAAKAKEEALKRQAEIERQQEAAREAAAKAERDSVIEQIDLLQERLGLLKEGTVEHRKNMELVKKAVAAGVITKDQAAEIVRVMAEAGEGSAKEFVNPWQSAADNVASSLQDAIASGDWDKIGDVIGNTLATSIAGIVNKTITDELSKGLTKDSSALAQIGGAFAGPIAGAVAGGAIQLAVSELSDFFSGSDWDPTEARQSSQGTGTVLGSIDAKSESIAKATDITATTNEQLVNINTGMLRALQNVQAGIQGAVAMTLRQNGEVNFTGRANNGSFDGLFGGFAPILGQTADLAVDYFDETIKVFTLGLLDGFISDGLGDVFGGGQKVVDEGIRILGGNLSDLVNETLVQAYATIKEDGGWFGSDKRFDRFQDIATNQFALAFESIYDSVEAGAEALGLLPAEIQSRLDRYVVETQRISLEGLSAEEQSAELEAVFSTIFDDIAGAVVPYLDEFQRAGEGLGETLARVASQVQLLTEAATVIGTTAVFSSQGLAEAADNVTTLVGGIEAFSSAIIGFEDNFLSEADKLQSTSRRLGEAMGDLPLPETRAGFLALVQAQDLTTQAGQENIATLLRLQSAADEYYNLLEQAQNDALSALRESINAQIDLIREQRQALEDAVQKSSGNTDVIFGDLTNIVAAEKQAAQDRLNAAKEAVNAEAKARQDAINAEAKARQDAINAEAKAQQDAINAEAKAQQDANRSAIDAVRELASTLESELRQVESSLEGLVSQTIPTEVQRASALATLQRSLTTGDFEGVGEASQVAADIQDRAFGSFAEFAVEQGRTANLLSRVASAANDQLSDAERTIAALEAQTATIEATSSAQIAALELRSSAQIAAMELRSDDQIAALESSAEAQIAAAEAAYNEESARLDGILENAQEQIDELRGNRESITSLDEAIAALEESMSDEAADRKALEQSNYEAEIERLNGIYDTALEQLNTMRGIQSGVLSVEEALRAFRSSLEAQSGQGSDGIEVEDSRIVSAAENYFLKNADVRGAFEGQVPAGASWDLADLRRLAGSALNDDEAFAKWHWENYGKYEGRQGYESTVVPAFANGGMHTGGLRLVGERGSELEMTGPSRIVSHENLMSALGASREMVNEIRALRTENLAAQRKIEKNTRELKLIQERWNQGGMPETREFV